MRSEFGASFVGRTDELRELANLLDERTLVTILGEGGVGKTRLAREVTRRLAAEGWPTFWIELGAVTDGARIRAAFEDVLRPSRTTDSFEGLIADRVPDGRALIVVDNCEHVLVDVAGAVRTIGSVRPDARLLATSRTRLGVAGEVVRRLGPLPVPEPTTDRARLGEIESVGLFVDRLNDVVSDFELGPDNADDVARLAAATEGVPLAIELIAASAGVLPLSEIARDLDELGHLAVEDVRREPRRHRSLDASVRWSVDRLGPEATAGFRRLGVFADTFRLTSAVRVIADGAHGELAARTTFAELVDASLVRRVGDDRYALPMAVRTFAQEELAVDPDVDAVRDRHAAIVHDIVAEAHAGLRRHSGDSEVWLRLIDLELPEIRVAVGWQLSRERPDAAAELLLHTYDHAHMRGRYGELTARCRDVLAQPLLPRPLSAQVAATASLGAVMAGRLADGFEFADHAVSVADDPTVRSDALSERAWSGFFSGRIDHASLWRDVDEALRLAESSGSELRRAGARQRYGSLLVIGRSIDDGRRVLRETAESRGPAPEHMVLSSRLFALYGVPVFGLRLDELWDETTSLIDDCRAAGHVAYESMALANAGAILALRRDADAADEHLGRARDLTVRHELPTFENVVQRWRAFAHYCVERPDALDQAEHALQLAERTGNQWDAAAARWLIALVVLGEDDEVAGAHLRAAATASARTGYPSTQSRADLGLALLDLGADRFTAGIARIHEAIVRSHGYGDLLAVAAGLDHLARFECEREAVERAARFAGAADAIYGRAGIERLPCERDLRVVVADRLADGDAGTTDAALAEGRALDPDAAVRLARRSRGRRSRPVSGWSSLTPTERDVADLAAAGFANRAIAERLVMSPNTVKTHLSHVYAKVGVAGRSELAAERARQSGES